MIDNFKINNYKCFEDFELNNLSQINIISGCNNVGKTALLEAISVSTNTTSLRLFKKNIEDIFVLRGFNFNDIYSYLKNIFLDVKYLNKKILIRAKQDNFTNEELEKLQQQYVSSQVKDFLVMYNNDNFQDILPLEIDMERSLVEYETSFIDSSRPDNYYLTHLYSKVQELNKQDVFLKYFQIIDNNIVGIEPYLTQRIAHDAQSIPSTVLRITVANPLKSLVLIYKIENGIHYSKLYDIWKAIIEIVQKENIQLFVTTHDIEAINALNRASEDMEFEKITSVTLEKDIIYPIIRKYSSFTATVDSGMDIR